MKIISSSSFLLVCLLMIACKQGDQSATHEHGEADQPGMATGRPGSNYTDDSGHTINMNVKLNNGEKWEANIETTNGIGTMSGVVGEMPENPTIEDYRGLHVKLSTEFQTILQQCTMKGEAHNQLHNYLMPLKEKINVLETGDPEACQKILPDIKEYLVKYSHFFYT